jgi:hypothetical protein
MLERNLNFVVQLITVFVSGLALVKGYAHPPGNDYPIGEKGKCDFIEQIDLTKAGVENVITLPFPDKQDRSTARQIILPEFTRFCHFAADSNVFRWIVASNRMFPWIGNSDLTSVFQPKDPVPPRIPSPNKRALTMLFKLKNGKFLTLLPLSGSAGVSWLEIGPDGILTIDYGSLGTEPVSQVSVPLLSWHVSDDIYESVRKMWEAALNTPPVKGNAFIRHKKEYPDPMKYLGCGYLGTIS